MGLLTFGIGAVVAGVGGVFAAPAVIAAAGFTAGGIAAGSIASSMMSAAALANGGGVVAGSTVALLQSAGVVGIPVAAQAVIGAVSSVGGAVAAAVLI